jgi:hypothetical protein
MNREGYQGSSLLGLIIIGVIALRAILFLDSSNLLIAVALIAAYSLLYVCFGAVAVESFYLEQLVLLPVPNGTGAPAFQSAPVFGYLIRPVHSAVHPGGTHLCTPSRIDVADLLHWLAQRYPVGWYVLGEWAGAASALFCNRRISNLVRFTLLAHPSRSSGKPALADLQIAHERLQVYAAQAEELA